MCRLLSGALIAFLLLAPTSSHRIVVNSNAFGLERGRSNGTPAGVINSSEGLDLVAQPAASHAVGPKSSNVAKTAEARMHRVGRKCFNQHAHSVNATNGREPFDFRGLLPRATPHEDQISIEDTTIVPSGGVYIKFVSLAPFTVHLGAADGWIGFPCGWSNDLSYRDHHTVAYGGGKMSVTVSAAFKYDWVHETGVLGLQYAGSAATKALFSAAISALYSTPFLTAHAAAHLASAGIAGTAVFSICPWCGLVAGIIMLGLTVTNTEVVDYWSTNLLYSTGFFYMSNLLRQHVNHKKELGEELEETWSVLVKLRAPVQGYRMEELKLMKLETLSEIFGDARSKLTYVKEAFDQATNFRENRSEIYMSVAVVEQFLKEMHTWGTYQETVWSSPASHLTKTLFICGGFGKPIETNAYLVSTGQEMIRQLRPRSPTPDDVRSSGADTLAERGTRPSTPRKRPDAGQLPGGGNVQPRAKNPIVGEPTKILHVWSYFPMALRETEDECACIARVKPALIRL